MIVLHQEHPSQCRVDVPYIYLRLTKDTLSKHIAKGYNHRGVWVLTVNILIVPVIFKRERLLSLRPAPLSFSPMLI